MLFSLSARSGRCAARILNFRESCACVLWRAVGTWPLAAARQRPDCRPDSAYQIQARGRNDRGDIVIMCASGQTSRERGCSLPRGTQIPLARIPLQWLVST